MDDEDSGKRHVLDKVARHLEAAKGLLEVDAFEAAGLMLSVAGAAMARYMEKHNRCQCPNCREKAQPEHIKQDRSSFS